MRRAVFLGRKKLSLDPRRAVGKGGEADVYRLDDATVVKVWKHPDHPDLAGSPIEQDAARQRLEVMQEKMRALPLERWRLLPARVITPRQLATDKTGSTVLGYAMDRVRDATELARFGERSFRAASGISANEVRDILLDLRATVEALHSEGVVIGDFNDLNVLVREAEAYLIDVDSYQLGGFPCTVYTERFLDPILCDGARGRLTLDRPFEQGSDWFAFNVILMRSLLFVGPYGGVYRPVSARVQVAPAERPLKRITVFHPDVRYPKPAAPLECLPDDLLHHLHLVFEEDRRVPFPGRLLEGLRFERCPSCGTEHARPVCPRCGPRGPAGVTAPQPVITTKRLVVTTLLETAGTIVASSAHDGKLLWLCHDGNAYVREDGRVVLRGPLRPGLTFRLLPRETLVAQGGRLIRLDGSAEREHVVAVDVRGRTPAFDVGAGRCFWADGGLLLRDGDHGPEVIGEVLQHQTRLWAGERLGFGLSRAGEVTIAFLFATVRRGGLDDSVQLPTIRGKLTDADCVLADDRAWLFTITEGAGRRSVRCVVIGRDGRVEAEANETSSGGQGWLGAARGRCAAGRSLLVATDDGVARVDLVGSALSVTERFPETEPFVDSECLLHPCRDGLAVVARQSIRLLRMA